MLPPIAIPESSSRLPGGGGSLPCLICNQPVKEKTAHWVVLDPGLGQIVDPETEPNGGCFPVGAGCWKKHKELKAYEIRV